MLSFGTVATSKVISVGYEGRTAAEFITDLASLGVEALVDVRLNAISRKRGLSKTALSDGLAEAGIDYHHLRALGNPRENRDAFRKGLPEGVATFEEVLSLPAAQKALEELQRLAEQHTLGIMCFELEHETCHRSAVIDFLGEDYDVVHMARPA